MNITRRQALIACASAAAAQASVGKAPMVNLRRVPQGGLQPQAAVDIGGALHMVYYTGDSHAGNLLYVTSKDGGLTFSPALPVNSAATSAIAAGSIRGAQMALGHEGSVHVAWNGSAGKPPMFYARLVGKRFDAPRNVMTKPSFLDGGGSIAADTKGDVSVMWHNGQGDGEAHRAVYIAQSRDSGASFTPERKATNEPTGACGCCGMKSYVARSGAMYVLYRSAVEGVHRDVYLLTSEDGGKEFRSRLLHKWDINACPMTSMDIVENGGDVIGAWETSGQIFHAKLNAESAPVATPGEGKGRKHPRLAVNKSGDLLLVWTEGTGFSRGGSLAWQVYDRAGQPLDAVKRAPGIPTSSFAAAAANADGSFSILY